MIQWWLTCLAVAIIGAIVGAALGVLAAALGLHEH